ncbi:hypothetical protein PAXRUDRAFT_829667 [Paxillus rubicundulus Ve08.2h10]|uniref:BHLH domain-containing protein n=1 Tax=Paxillus rubicundulus Ve08.2h10 TaxID=930991 RepID=A0A0D0DUJ5_9AGAM|nr:hypothetical protein PAXRUDRAFT_829667 [Paxillus rubicundulus Ve08.2h10]
MSSALGAGIVPHSDDGTGYQPDLVLDPSDPLNLLLNNSNDTDSELSQAATPPDWSQFNSLWSMPSTDPAGGLPSTGEKSKLTDLGTGFDFSFPMDLDFNDPSFSMAIDPNSLLIDGKGLPHPLHDSSAVPIQPQDLLHASFPFPFVFSSPTLSSASASSQSTDESSSPRISPGNNPASPVGATAPKTTAEAIAAFFSQANRPSGQSHMTSIPEPVVTLGTTLAGTHWRPSSSASSSPSPASATRAPEVQTSSTTVIGRPKTSHTTIERRYRTNLNARIQSLKAAVPALRVLDQSYKSDEHKVDDRGYIDGVKIARKGSKANVLAKAVEYIHVLKRREARLNRQQDGLRALICKFSGGQNILAEWESEWAKKFGGPERDEIDNVGAEEASDDDDGDGDGEDDGDSLERARKKLKVTAVPQKKEKRKLAPAAPTLPAPGPEVLIDIQGTVPEKRKRGRPRKIQPHIPPPIVASDLHLTDPSLQQGITAHPAISQTAQPQQYLLAVFALFSFFSSPLASSSEPVSHHHTHQGSVLSHVTSPSPSSFASPTVGWTWSNFVQVIHLLASLAVFISIIVPWIPVPQKLYQSRFMWLIPFGSLISGAHGTVTSTHGMMDFPTPPSSPDVSDTDSEAESTSDVVRLGGRTKEGSDPLAQALSLRGGTDEFESLLNALNVGSGWVSMIRSIVGTRQAPRGPAVRRERQARMRLAELIVLSPENAMLPLRWQVYNYLSFVSGFPGSEVASTTLVSDICTLALLSHTLPLPFTKTRSQTLWSRARGLVQSDVGPTFEHLVFDNMTVEKAAESLASSKPMTGSSPIAVLASTLLRERLHAYASSLFIHRVTRDQDSDSDFPSHQDSKTWRVTITFGRSLGGDIGLLSDAFAKVWQRGIVDFDVGSLQVGPADEDIRALLSATVLYDRVFSRQEVLCRADVPGGDDSIAFVLSPPRTPHSKMGGKDSRADVVLQLHRALGSSVFEENAESSTDGVSLEDARDRVVDMIVTLEKGERLCVV